MPKINGIRFHKLDPYGNFVFIANSEKETATYAKLVGFSDQLSEKYNKVFSPIYYNSKFNYATIRVVKDRGIQALRLKANDKVNLRFQISRKKKDNGKIYLNCHLINIKLLYRAPPVDYGEDCELYDSSDTEADTDTGTADPLDVGFPSLSRSMSVSMPEEQATFKKLDDSLKSFTDV